MPTNGDADPATGDSSDRGGGAAVADRLRRIADRLRRPSHIGARRCWPCTLFNLGILGVGCVALALVEPIAAAALAVAGVVAIALRGYLVPYTPVVAPRIAAALPGDVFRKASNRPSGSITEARTGDVGERLFVELDRSGVLAVEGETIALSPSFRDRWESEMTTLREASLAELSRAVATTTGCDDVDAFEGSTRAFVVLSGGSGTVSVSRHVAVAEVAAARAISEFAPQLDEGLRLAATRPVRMFAERCPVCESAVVETEPEACCGDVRDPRSMPDAVLACPSCDVRLFSFDDE